MRWQVAALLLLLPAAASAQIPDSIRLRGDSLRRDSLRIDSLRQDSARGRVVPRAPSRKFPDPDSIMQALLERRGFTVTRYAADSVQLLAPEKEIRLAGEGLIERAGSTLEADTVRYAQENCILTAAGSPRLFDPSGTLMGEGMRYDACNKTGVVRQATTDLQHGGGTWVLRGDIAVDNVMERTYASGAEISSCQLIEPHYHFEARQVKWVSKSLMVARPAVLYVADVPIVWLPFVFQDTRRGRRSGILPPQFGINDIVRFNRGYQRHITNVGYYLAISDYTDAQVKLDWYAARSVSISGRFRYKLLDRFLEGGIELSELHESGGRSSRSVAWGHRQSFNVNTSLTANLYYASSSEIITRNSVNPRVATGTIDSRLNFQRRFSFGQFNIGGSRSQSLDKPQISTSFPSGAFTPNPIAITRSITWSPALTFSNSLVQNQGPGVAVFRPAGFDTLLNDSRTSDFSFQSPVRIGSWTLTNGFSLRDTWSDRRSTITVFPDPTDSTRRQVRTFAEAFQTEVDWNIGFGLPPVFQGTWNLQPSMSLVNTGGGSYLIRNQFTGGRYLSQGKRPQFSLSATPTLFALFPGIGSLQRIRHSISPSVQYHYSPAARIDSAFALAQGQGRAPATLRIPSRQAISIGLSQNFEGKFRPGPSRDARAPRTAAARQALAPDSLPRDSIAADSLQLAERETDSLATPDTTGGLETAEGRKIKLLSIQSGAIGYDFEQAKLPGRSGWTTDAWPNTISSDLIRGFQVQTSFDLFEGEVGTDTARLRPFLTTVGMNFSITPGTLAAVGRLFGIRPRRDAPPAAAPPDSAAADSLRERNAMNPSRDLNNFQGGLLSPFGGFDARRPIGGTFNASLNFQLSRQRPVPAAPGVGPAASTTTSTVSSSVTFQPTRNWSVAWQTSYNFTRGEFSEQSIRFDRDLHDWRATFAFVRSPNGNFAFNFFIELIAEPDLKFAYDQRNTRENQD